MGDPIYTCGHNEAALAGVTPACRWPDGVTVGVFHDIDLTASGLSAADVAGVFARACAGWSAACGLDVRPEADEARARVVARLGTIDGPWGVLGLTFLPCSASPQSVMGMKLDSAGPWDIDMFEETVVHELGHALGLSHAPQLTGAVMEPILTGNKVPRLWDINEAQARYGPPLATSAPAPSTPQSENSPITIRVSIPTSGDYDIVLSVRPAPSGL